MTEPAILLVEDDVALRTMMQGIMDLAGFQTYEAGSRQDALEILHRHGDIGVALVDLGLPPHPHATDEGLALLQALRQEAFSLKAIVLTGQDQASAALAAIREGAFDFLAKPSSSETILAAVRRACLFVANEQVLRLDGFARIEVNTRLNDGMKSAREQAEERLVRQVLRDTGFNVYQTAKRLGIKRENVYYFLKKFGIQRDD